MAQNFLSDIKLGDNIYIRLGDRGPASGGGDLNLSHNGTNSFIDNHTGQLYIRNFSDDKNIHLQSDDGSGGMTDYIVIHGSENIVKFQEHSRHLDNKEARFGTGSDLKIYHESATGHSHIKEAGTGELRLSANIFRVLNANTSETMIYAEQDGKVQLRYNESAKLETTAGGIDITGTIDASGTIVSTGGNIRVGSDTGKFLAGASNDLQIYHDGNNSKITNITGGLYIGSDTAIGFQSADHNTNYLTLTSSSATFEGTVRTKDTVRIFKPSQTSQITYSAAAGLQLHSQQSVSGSPYTKTSDIVANADGTVPSELRLFTKGNGDSTPSERIRVTSAGKVGIGTGANVDEKLHVQGNIKFEQASGNIDVRYTSNGTNKYNMFYEASTDAWGVYYNPSNAYRLFLNSSGNFGIGTSSPTTLLDLGTGNTQGDGIGFGSNISEIRRGNSGTNLQMSHWGNISMIIDSDGNDSSRFFNVMHNNNDSSSATELFRVQENGNVGINDVSPSKGKLQINQQSNTLAAIQLTNSSQTSSNHAAYPISIFFGDEQVGSNARHQASINAVREAWNNSPAALTFKTSATVNGATEKMRITSAGNVAIGKTNPSFKLDVDAGSNAGIFLTGSSDARYHVFSTSSSNWVGYELRSSNSNTFAGGIFRNNADNDRVSLYNKTTEAISLKDGGDVGIGTTSPDVTLHVNSGGGNLISVFESTDAVGKIGLQDNTTSNNYSVAVGVIGDDMTLHSGSGGTEAIRINSSQNVGIGTNSPDKLLHLNQTGNNVPLLVQTDDHVGIQVKGGNSHDRYISFQQANGTVGAKVGWDHSSQVLKLNAVDTFASTHLVVDVNGKVGIGTAAPYKKLEVTGDIQLDGTDANIWIKSGAAGTNGFINWTFNTNDTVYNKVGIDYDTRATTGFHIDAGYPITIDGTTRINFALAGSNKGAWDTTGLGIGTASPATPIHVDGGSNNLVGKVVSSSSTRTEFALDNTSTNNVRLGLKSTPTGVVIDSTNHSGSARQPMLFQMGGGTHMTMGTDGYIGMGIADTNNQRLTLAEADANGSHIKMNNSRSGGGYWVVGVGDSGSSSSIVDPGGLFFYNGTTKLKLDSSGNATFAKDVTAKKLIVDGASHSNVSRLALTRTDFSWGIFNETNLRFYVQSGNTTTPNSQVLEIATNGNTTIAGEGVFNGGLVNINGTTTSVLAINANTHDTNTANSADLNFSYAHSGGGGVGFIRLTEDANNSFGADMTFGVPHNNGSGSSTTRTALTLDGGTLAATFVGNIQTDFQLLGRAFRGANRGELHLNATGTDDVAEIFFGHGSGYTEGNIRWAISDRGTTDGNLKFYRGPANGGFQEQLTLHKNGLATFQGGVKVDNGDLILGEDAFSVSADYVGIKTSHQSGTNDYMIISGTSDGSTYVSSKSGSTTYIRAGGNHNTHQLAISSTGAVFSGDLQVNGNLNIVGNSSVVNVEDINVEANEITLNYNASSGTNSTAGGAGIRIQDAVDNSTDATISWSSTEDHFTFSHPIEIDGPNINGMKFGIKQVTLTENTFTDTLTINMPNYRACYVKIVVIGDWPSHSSIQFLGEYFVHNGGGAFGEPGMVIKEIDNTETDTIVSQIVDPSGNSGDRDFVIQLKADDTTSTPADATVFVHYEVRGQFNSIT